jgi:hypothetical protein
LLKYFPDLLQKEQRKAYWKYIENIIFDLPIKDSDQHQYSDFKPKKLFSFSALYLSPFLNAGATFACFQSLGMVPVSIDFIYILFYVRLLESFKC